MGHGDALAVRPALRNAWSSVRLRPLRLWAVAAVMMIADGSCFPSGSTGAVVAAGSAGATTASGSASRLEASSERPELGPALARDPTKLPRIPGEPTNPSGAPESARPDSTGPDSTGPDSTGPESAGPDSTGPESAGPEPAGPEGTVPADSGGPTLSGALCLGLTVLLWFLALGSLVMAGYLRVLAGTLEGHGTPWSLFRSGFGRFRDMFAWTLLAGAIQVGAALAASLPGVLVVWLAPHESLGERIGAVFMLSSVTVGTVWVGLGLFFGAWLVALEDMRARQALRTSWQLAQGRRPRLLLLVVAANALAMASLLGVLLCGIGLLISAPLGRAFGALALTDAFRRLRSGPVPSARPR